MSLRMATLMLCLNAEVRSRINWLDSQLSWDGNASQFHSRASSAWSVFHLLRWKDTSPKARREKLWPRINLTKFHVTSWELASVFSDWFPRLWHYLYICTSFSSITNLALQSQFLASAHFRSALCFCRVLVDPPWHKFESIVRPRANFLVRAVLSPWQPRLVWQHLHLVKMISSTPVKLPRCW